MSSILTIEEAESQGLRPLTTTCNRSEYWIIWKTLAELRQANIPCAPVQVPGGLEVWRSNNGWLGGDEP